MTSWISKISLSLCLFGCSQQLRFLSDHKDTNDKEHGSQTSAEKKNISKTATDEASNQKVGIGYTPIPENADYSVSVPPAPEAGGQTSGGGPGIVCRESDKSLRSVEPLDLYEGKILRGLVYPPWAGTRDEILAQWVATFSFHETIKRDLPKALTHIKSVWQELPQDVTILASPDIWGDSAVVMPSGCTIELIGFYQKDGKLRVSPSLFNKLTPMEQAAFMMHEAVYYLARQRSFDSGSSAGVRQLIASLAAKSPELNKQSEILTWGNGYLPLFLTKGAAPAILVQVDNPLGLDATISAFCNDTNEQPSYRVGKKTTVNFSNIEHCEIFRIMISSMSNGSIKGKIDDKDSPDFRLNFRMIYGDRILREGILSISKREAEENWTDFPLYFE